MSTHTSIVKETVPVLLQHLQKLQKGNSAAGSSEQGWAGDAFLTGDGLERVGVAVVLRAGLWILLVEREWDRRLHCLGIPVEFVG